MVKMLLKIAGIIILLIAVFLVWFDQSRSFYCLSEDKCITVWKRLDSKCYIVPGKYYGIFKPSNDYIKTTNTNIVDVIWKDKGNLLIASQEKVDVFNEGTNQFQIDIYNNQKLLNDSLYTIFDGKYRKYRKEIEFLSINIKENYARDKTGNKLK